MFLEQGHGQHPRELPREIRGQGHLTQQWVQMNVGYAGKNNLEAASRTGQAAVAQTRKDSAQTSKDAIATLVSTPEYALGAVVLARTLRATGSAMGKDLVALVPPHDSKKLVGKKESAWLRDAGWIVRRVSWCFLARAPLLPGGYMMGIPACCNAQCAQHGRQYMILVFCNMHVHFHLHIPATQGTSNKHLHIIRVTMPQSALKKTGSSATHPSDSAPKCSQKKNRLFWYSSE